MTSLIKDHSEFQLTPEKVTDILSAIKNKIKNRVEGAYVFGSSALAEVTKDSDIDLIFVVKESSIPFVQRSFEFIDLFEIWPRLDILVYTPKELEDQLADSSLGFWKSVRLSMRAL